MKYKLIFQVKILNQSMPNAAETRNMIRSTWLNKAYWHELGFEVKTLFLVASQNDVLEKEIKKYDDILLLDFKENHYGLPAKDFHFLEFIENKCRFVGIYLTSEI